MAHGTPDRPHKQNMPSIKQNPAGLPLPDFRNVGVMLRILLGVNLLAAASASFAPRARASVVV